MVTMGVLHWMAPIPFVAAMPGYLPEPLALVLISGVFEVAGGVGILIPRLRAMAGWGLIALFVAVYPANINMALHPGDHASLILQVVLWCRLPLQIPLIYWALRVSDSGRREAH